MILNENQILFLEFILKNKGIKSKETQGELLDHLATNIEIKMKDKMLFHEALDQALKDFGEDNFLSINQQNKFLFHQKIKKNMKRFAVLIFILLSSIFYLFGNTYFQDERIDFVERDNTKIDNNINAETPQRNIQLINHEPPEIYPVIGDFPIVATFGRRMHPIQKVMKHHKGIDIKAPIGTDVVASSDGIVIQVLENELGYGKHIIIKHDEVYKTLYAHLSKIDVKKGDNVNKGQKIGEIGTSGSSLNPHLHYEVIKEGKKVNPEKYVSM